MKLKELKKGDYFVKVKKDGTYPMYPKPNQVFIKDDYDRSTRKFFVFRFNDICDSQLLKGDTEVTTDFIF